MRRVWAWVHAEKSTMQRRQKKSAGDQGAVRVRAPARKAGSTRGVEKAAGMFIQTRRIMTFGGFDEGGNAFRQA